MQHPYSQNVSPSLQTFWQHRGGCGRCRWLCAQCGRVGALSPRLQPARRAHSGELCVNRLHLRQTRPINMRVPFSILHPVLSITVFGFYPSMVSFLSHHLMAPPLVPCDGAFMSPVNVNVSSSALGFVLSPLTRVRHGVRSKIHPKSVTISCCSGFLRHRCPFSLQPTSAHSPF